MKLHIESAGSMKVLPVLLFALLLAPHARVFAQTPFYQGKTIVLARGSTPGGIGELRMRALIQVVKKHIPGQPDDSC